MKDELIDKIVDFLVKYLEESGLLEEILAKLIDRLLKR